MYIVDYNVQYVPLPQRSVFDISFLKESNFCVHQLQSVSAQWRSQRGDKRAKESS